VAYLNRENKNEFIVDIINSAYMCVGNATAKRGAANDEVWGYYSYLCYINLTNGI
jgi:hypothetical protein